MKLSVKLAGLFGSGVFIITALPGFYQHVKPASMQSMVNDVIQGMDILETLGISLGGAILAGAIGYLIGDILSKPQGKPQHGTPKSASERGRPKSSPAVTGEETFLDDLAPPPQGGNIAETVMPKVE